MPAALELCGLCPCALFVVWHCRCCFFFSGIPGPVASLVLDHWWGTHWGWPEPRVSIRLNCGWLVCAWKVWHHSSWLVSPFFVFLWHRDRIWGGQGGGCEMQFTKVPWPGKKEKKLSLLCCPEWGGKFEEVVGGVELSLLVVSWLFQDSKGPSWVWWTEHITKSLEVPDLQTLVGSGL